MQAYPKRLIEVDLPIRRISAHARREKSIRHGHISTLHIWWARRPLAACRAVICASLWPDPADGLCPETFRQAARVSMLRWANENLGKVSVESYPGFIGAQKNPERLNDNLELRGVLLDFIADFANWDNSTDREYLDTTRTLTQAAHEALGGDPDTRPLVVDPFAGGGSIPLEALRVGADTFASDLNPLPVLLNKVVVEYIPRYGKRLIDEFQAQAANILAEISNSLHDYYPDDQNAREVSTYIWFKTILSEAPDDSDFPIELPLMRSMWLSKGTANLALRWTRDSRGKILTRIKEIKVCDGSALKVREPLLEIFSPRSAEEVEIGTSKGGAATCPITGYTTPVESVRRQLSERKGGSADARIGCIVSTSKDSPGRMYRIANDSDLKIAQKASDALTLLKNKHVGTLSLLPDGKLNHLRGFFNVVLYGMTNWCDLFSPRQSLALSTISQLIKDVKVGSTHNTDDGFKEAVQTCLAMALGRLVDYGSSLCVWAPAGEFVCHTFGRQALPMVWDFAETNPLSGVGWPGAIEWVRRVLEANADSHSRAGNAVQASALEHPLPDDAADATITDPPYYAAIPYADLSDFFYGWLKRTLGETHKDLFATDLAPKEDECVSLSIAQQCIVIRMGPGLNPRWPKLAVKADV